MEGESDKLFDGEIFQTVFLLSRTKHLKIYIANKYRIKTDTFDIIKVGPRIWMYMVSGNKLVRGRLFIGPLESVNGSELLKNYLNRNIESFLKKHGMFKPI